MSLLPPLNISHKVIHKLLVDCNVPLSLTVCWTLSSICCWFSFNTLPGRNGLLHFLYSLSSSEDEIFIILILALRCWTLKVNII